MKNPFLIIAIVLCFVAACKNETCKSTSAFEEEATAIAKDLNDEEELKKHIARYDSLNDRQASLIVMQKLGSVMRNRSQFDSAVAIHQSCIEIAEEIKDTLQLIIAFNNQGTNFRRLGDLEQASRNHYMALGLCDNTIDDTSYIARKNRVRTLNGLGNVMLSLGDMEIAEDMFRRALQGERELGSATGQAINYANIGAIKESEGEIDSARIYYNLSMEKNRECNNLVGISLCYQNIGELDEATGKYSEARENYMKSYETGVQANDIWHWLNPCTALATLSLKEGNIEEAEQYNRKALEAATRIKAKGRLGGLYSIKSGIHEVRGEYKEALECNKISNAYKDSAAIEENRKYTQNLLVNYEISKKAKEVEKAQTEAQYEKEMRNIILWSSIVTIILILFGVVALIRSAMDRKRANMLLEKTNRERQEFYRGITHQLRTPLTVIIGMTHELERFIPQDNELAQKEFDAVTRKSKELLDLVAEMTRYNQGKRGEPIVSELQESHAPEDDSLIQESTDGIEYDYILVAEDDRDVALLITQMLKSKGYRYRWAHNGHEACRCIGMGIPRLIITDIMMPGMDGLELIKSVRADENTAHIPIIVVSARNENNDRLAGFDAGAEVYLGKPFIPDELLIMVRKLLEQREMLKKKYSLQIEEADKVNNIDLAKGVNKNEQQFIKRINEYISENIMECNLNAAMLAEHMIMSITTLNRKINGITGTNTTNYIRQRKLARAKYLLKKSTMSMGEIQIVCGFETPSYFSRAFKGEFGITPTEYRKNL